MALSRGSTLTPCSASSPTPPAIPVQPDHFYGSENVQFPPSPDSDGKTWLDPEDDPVAHRGIPVFKPTMEEFQDFEGYMNRVQCWGMKSGIVKVIPPKEWTESLPELKTQLVDVKIKTPIEQHMMGSCGLFRQENMEKRKLMSVREWVELCTKDEYRAPGVQEVGLSSRNLNLPVRTRAPRKKAEAVLSGPAIKEEPSDESHSLDAVATPPHSEGSTPAPSVAASTTKTSKGKKKKKVVVKEEPKPRPKRIGQTREAREASQAQRAARDLAFLEVFDPADEWLPPSTKADDYNPEFCLKLERHYWRNCGLGRPAWYGADTQGSLFTDATTAWNVAHLPSTLSRLLPSSTGLPGVNTPYLYFGMWRATFAWHVEDMDLFSINYIHFGAPKFWYAIPQGRAPALESVMRSYFPKDTSQCPQFLRHKSFLASPSVLGNSACRPNTLVQQAGEFVITYPRGYHAGFNLGLNCAESVNFALESWLDIGRRAKACECISDSVRIDVDQLLRDREEERIAAAEQAKIPVKVTKKVSSKKDTVKKEAQDELLPPPMKTPSRKRKSDANAKEEAPRLKKIKIKHSPSKPSTISIPAAKPPPKLSVTLKLGPRPAEQEPFPCCLCVSMSKEGLLRVHEPPLTRKDAIEAAGNPQIWMAHEQCARIIPETWVDELDGPTGKEQVVFGVDIIVKDRWNLKCSACTKNKPKAHGAPVQCTKGKCPKAFHVNCAREGHSMGIVYGVVREVVKEVVLLDPSPSNVIASSNQSHDQMQVDSNSSSPGSHQNAMPIQSVPSIADVTADSHFLKTIKKLEVQILCTQHNPAVAAQKKASKSDKIRTDLLALPAMARIKIRVSAGVFEVSLVRVIEETCSVEVLWDRGLKREFKWGSVVFGSTDGPVLQKPSELAVEPERTPSVLLAPTYPSVLAATGHQPYASGSNTPYPASASTPVEQKPLTAAQPSLVPTLSHQYAPQTHQRQPPPNGSYNHWSYATQYGGGAQTSYPYPYNGYYSNRPAGGSSHYGPYTYMQSYSQPQYRGGQLHWQQPYQGPAAGQAPSDSSQASARSSTAYLASQTTSGPSYYRDRSQALNSSHTPTLPQPSRQGSQQEDLSSSSSTSTSAIATPPNDTGPRGFDQNHPHAVVFKDLAALSSMQASQIADILCSNPQLRDLVKAAVDQAKLS